MALQTRRAPRIPEAGDGLLRGRLSRRRRRVAFERLEPRVYMSSAWDVAVIDTQLERPDLLVQAAATGTRVILFDGRRESAAEVLRRVTDLADSSGWRIRSLSVFSHGAAGSFALGNDRISAATLDQTADAWRALGRAMAADADIYIYGCHVASEFTGERLIGAIADITGADVFGSTDLTGLGGNWLLEASSPAAAGGRRDLGQTFNRTLLEQYVSSLAAPTITTSGGSLAYTPGHGAAVIDAGIGVSDGDSADLAGATIQITGNYTGSEDLLGFMTTGTDALLQQNAPGGNKIDVKLGLKGSQSFRHGSLGDATYYVRKLVLYLSREVEAPDANLVVSIGTGINTGAVAGSSVSINPSSITDTSAGTTFQTYTITYSSPLALTAGATYYINLECDATNGKGVYLEYATSSTYANGAYYKQGADDSKDLRFQLLTGAITGSWDSASGTLTLTGTDTVANYQAALRSVTYTNDSGTNPATRTVSFIATDGTATSSAATRTITFTANQPPALAGIEGTTLSYVENEAATAITSSLTVSDAGSANLTGATVRITGSYKAGEDLLSFVDTANITGNWNSATGTLTLSGTATVAEYQAALRSVKYHNTSDSPNTSTRTVSFTVNDGSASSNSATRNVSVTAVNDAPVLTSIEGTALPYNESDADTSISAAITITDADSSNLSGAMIQIIANYVNGEDELSFTDTGTITGTWNAATGTLTLNGVDTVANYQSALRGVKYRNTSESPTTAPRTVSFSVTDGSDGSNTVTRDIAVAAVNDAPTVDNPIADQSAIEDAAFSFQLPANTFGDVDGDPLVYAVTRADGSALPGWLNFDAASRTFSGTPGNVDVGALSVRVRATDGSGATTSDTFTITVANTNDAPAAVVDAYALNEDGALAVPVVAGVLANDGDVDGDPLSAALVSAPARGQLTLGSDGSFTYTPDPNYHGSDSFTYRATDGQGGSATTTVSITITPVADAPVSGADTYSVNEDGQLDVAAAAGVLANDSDADGDSLVAVLVRGPEHGTLGLNADGSFRYVPHADYAGPDSFTYRTEGAGLGGNTATVTIAVAAVNDGPRLLVPGALALRAGMFVVSFSAAGGNAIRVAHGDAPSGEVQLVVQAMGGLLALSRTDGLTMVEGEAGGERLVVRGTVEAVNAALDGLRLALNDRQARLRVELTDRGNIGADGSLVTTAEVSIAMAQDRAPSPAPLGPGPKPQPAPEDASADDYYYYGYGNNAGEGAGHGAFQPKRDLEPLAPGGGGTFGGRQIPVDSQITPPQPETAPQPAEPQPTEPPALAEPERAANARPALPAPTAAAPAQGAMTASQGTAPAAALPPGVLSAAAAAGLDRVMDEVARQLSDGGTPLGRKRPLVVGAAFTVSGALWAGYVVWLARGGSLLASLLSALPFWRWFDPLPVLDSWEQARSRRRRGRGCNHGNNDGQRRHDEDDQERKVESLIGP